LLVCNWPHSVGQNHLFEKMLFNRDSAIQKCFQKILHSLQVRKLCSLPAVRMRCQTVPTPIKQRGFRSKPSSVSRSFELLQLASVRTIQQPVRTILSVRSSLRISFQNTNMGILLQPSRRRGFPSGCSLKYKRSSAKFLEFRSHSCPSGRPMTTVWTAPSFIKPDAHLNC
jgi:hypothetical protein